jgi:O-antigen/teichoic acid export membrane protein
MARADPGPAFKTQSFRQLAQGFSASSVVYTAGVIALRFGGLLLIPLYWRYLEPADYGILAAAGVVTNFLAIFLGLAVSESITRFYHAWPAGERRAHIGTLWVLDWASSLAVGLPLAIWGGDLIQLAARQVAFAPYQQLGVFAAILQSLGTAPTTLLRVEERPRVYVACSAASFLVRTAVAILLVVGLGRGPRGVLEADVIAGLAMVPVWCVILLRSATPAWRMDTVRTGLGYSLPLVPGVFTESLMWTLDRFVLEKYVPLRALGLYSVADALGGVVRVVSGGLKTAWLPFAMRAAVERDDARLVIARVATLYVLVTTLVAAAVAMLAADLIAVIGVPAYFAAAPLVPLFVVTNGLVSLLPPALAGLGIARRTGYASAAAAVQFAVGAGALLILVPRWGIYGAIASVALSTVVRLAAGLTAAQRFYHVPFEWRRIVALALSAVAVFLAGRALPVEPSAAGLLARGLLFTAYAASAAWLLGVRQWWMSRPGGAAVGKAL